MKVTKFFTASALTLALATPAAAQLVLKGYDVDGDGQLTGAEARDLFDADGVVSLSTFDTDGDGVLSSSEFDALFGQAEAYWVDTGVGFNTFDANEDDVIDQEEYFQGFVSAYDLDQSGAFEAEEMQQMEEDFNAMGFSDS
ncbi:EF hand [Jannaschia seosinensis]|uniref:EF hand n=1 Tax=Jannaschia seosinensis TaxID=313367 RepID=A0A0M7BHF9_9RHOB|nr:hypothetical protein [Jannaschia seosinensis]CUH40825.1 EF hand [Jannaschia seosinensis]